jgi:HB1, ASXL, restriction endonuclease HTH domain
VREFILAGGIVSSAVPPFGRLDFQGDQSIHVTLTGRSAAPREGGTEMPAKAKATKSGKAAAIKVLRSSRKAMPVKEVVAKALADPEVTGMKGKTPAATLSAALYTEAKKPGGAVILVGRGMMKARPQRKASTGR